MLFCWEVCSGGGEEEAGFDYFGSKIVALIRGVGSSERDCCVTVCARVSLRQCLGLFRLEPLLSAGELAMTVMISWAQWASHRSLLSSLSSLFCHFSHFNTGL